MGRTSFAQAQNVSGAQAAPDVVGRWSLSVPAATDATSRSIAHGEAWLDRYGVLTRGSVVAEDVLGGFALAYKVLSGFEESGKAMRGYVIEGLGAAQFSTPAVIDRLRGVDDSPDVTGWPSGTREPQTYVLAATDPANPYGAALSWPPTDAGESAAHPTRAAGALVVLMDGLPVAHLTRGGKTLTTFFNALPEGIERTEVLAAVLAGLNELVAAGRLSKLVIEKANGRPIFESKLGGELRALGAALTPKGVRITGAAHTASSGRAGQHGQSGEAARSAEPYRPARRGGRRAVEAMEELTFDDPEDSTESGGRSTAPSSPGGFRPRRRRR